MNRIKFDAKILDLYSVDYEYLQNSIEDEVAKLLRQTMANPGDAGVIKGFKLKASPSDSSKIMIYSDGTWNSAVSNDGIMVEIEDDIDLIAPSASGVLNYIYIRSYTVDGTYNKTADVVEEDVQKAIDYYDYARVYDRQLDTWVVLVYTQAEYLNLTTAQQLALIHIGSFLATTPVSSISTSGRNNLKTFIANESVTTDSISTTDMLLPQAYVDNSAIIYDRYAESFAPENLEEDLNKIRSIMRSVRGTAVWDEVDANNLKVFDSSISALHSDGVFENVLDELDVIPNSTGLSVIVVSGKALTTGVMQSISDLSHRTVDITPQPSYFVYVESHSFTSPIPSGSTVTLDYQNINVVEVRGNTDGLYVGTVGSDYIVYASTGMLYLPSTSNFNPALGDLHIQYYYGFIRYDVIAIGPNIDIQVAQGVSAIGSGSTPNVQIPPAVPVIDAGYVPLAVIKVVPNISTFTYNHIQSYKRFTPWMRDLEFIPCNNINNIPTSVNRITYHNHEMTIDEAYLHWTPHVYAGNGMTYYQSTAANTFITTAVMCSDDDEVWLLVDKSVAANEIEVRWNISPEDADYDVSTSITIDLQWRYPLHFYPVKVTKGLSTGIHKFKITKVTATNPFNFYGVLVGKPDTFYQNYSQTEIETYFSSFLAEASTKNIAIGLNNLPSENAGSNNIAIGDSTLGVNATGDDNFAAGINALSSNSIGSRNIAINTDALKFNTQGNDDIAIGVGALVKNIDGDSNLALGSGALANNISGDNNIAIGDGAGSSVVNVNNTIVIGSIAGAAFSDRTYIDNIHDDTVTLPNSAPYIVANVAVDINGRLQRVTYPGTPPIGSIIAWLPGYFQSSVCVTLPAVIALLPAEWKICNGGDGTTAGQMYDADSPIFDTAGRYLPQLTDNRFLMGVSNPNNTYPSGTNSNTLTVNHIPQHSHSIYLSHTVTDPMHAHPLNFGFSNNIAAPYIWSTAGTTIGYFLDTDGVTYGTGTHVVTSSAVTGITVAPHNTTTGNYGTLSPTALENRPQYLSVYYIMRIK